MKISVVIPAHNAGSRLLQALDSVRSQTLAASEIVVVNDGSLARDTGISAVKSMCDVHCVTTSHQGPSAARNTGIAATRSEWVAFLDADDYWREDHLATAAHLLSGSRASLFLSRRMNFRESSPGVMRLVDGFATSGCRNDLNCEDFFDLFAERFYFCQSSVICRRECLGEGYNVNLHWGEDIELFSRAVCQVSRWAYSRQPTVYYRQDTPGSLSSRRLESSLGLFHALSDLSARPGYGFSSLERICAVAARRAMTASLALGDRETRAETWLSARQYLGRRDRFLLKLGICAPQSARWLLNKRYAYLDGKSFTL